MTFIGRDSELRELNALYRSPGSKLVVIHGRRRVGKSTLIEQFIKSKPALHFEGLEKIQTKGQISQFSTDLMNQVHEPLLQSVIFKAWTPVFDYLTQYFEKQNSKTILFLDEFQWLAANQSRLVSLLKSYWDRFWSKQNVMLILCGSVSSFMIKKVIQSKALYGRINWELCLQPLGPSEIFDLLDGKRSKDEVITYSMIFGGIPKYLQEINPNQSLDQNINRLFFLENSLFSNEYQRIFYSQFKEHQLYEAIARTLKDGPKTLEEISNATKLSSGGGLRSYLDNLEKAAFITSYIPYDKDLKSKLIKYKLTDEYLRFYFKFVVPHLKLIRSNKKRNLFSQLIKPTWNSWLGFAFENFCIKNAIYLAELMGFGDQVLQWGPFFQQGDTRFQIDLVYVRQDRVITVCEIKYHTEKIGVEIVNEMERKCKLIQIPRGYTLEKALISRFGPDDSLKTLKYFHHSILAEEFFE